MTVCLTVLFFTVTVGWMVRSVTWQLQQEGRTIGMLRAVGADGSILGKTYAGQFRWSIAGGTGLCLLAGLLAWVGKSRYLSQDMAGAAAAAVCLMAGICAVVCRCFLVRRIRQTLRQSVIENIREL